MTPRTAAALVTAKRSPPTAVAVVLAVLAVAAASPAALAAWRAPVPGAVARPFAYSPREPFVAGRHRGVDLAARAGATVRAPCSGRVAFAGRDVVTVRCGPWRVTNLPLARLAVRAGERVRAGARLGTLAESGEHAGLHLGVRRAGDRFGYVDPLLFLGGAGPPVAVPPVAVRIPRAGPRARLRKPRPPPPAARPRAVRDEVRVPSGRPPVPWPVWAGLVLALAGALGGGIRVRARRRRTVAEAVAS